MNLHAIIDEVADEADDFLAGAGNRSEARAGIAEKLNLSYPHLSAADRTQVTEAVMAILEAEDFFAGGGPVTSDLDGGEEGDEEDR